MKKLFKPQYNLLRDQYVLLASLCGLVICPYVALFKLWPDIPNTEYIFIVLLVLIKLTFFPNNKKNLKLENKLRKHLQKQIKKSPSREQLFKRIVFYQKSVDAILLSCGVLIIIIGIYNQRL